MVTRVAAASGFRRPVRAQLVVNASFHDADLVRLRLLELLARHPGASTRCSADFNGIPWGDTTLLVTYTHNVFPTRRQHSAMEQFLRSGGRWLALHASAASTRFQPPPVRTGGIELPGHTATPDNHRRYMDLLGVRMLAHLPISSFEVKRTRTAHPITRQMQPFAVEDEPFILQIRRREIRVLLASHYVGEAPAYVRGPWWENAARPIMTSRRIGAGEVVYLALGHARAWHSLQPYAASVPAHAGPWRSKQFLGLLHRALTWGLGEARYGHDPSGSLLQRPPTGVSSVTSPPSHDTKD